jgi:hypothetical protein
MPKKFVVKFAIGFSVGAKKKCLSPEMGKRHFF